MKKLVMTVAAILPLVAAAGTGNAQKLETGKWTGTVTPPGATTVDVTYDVAMTGDTMTVSVNAPPGSFAFRDLKLADGKLTFWFAPGPRVDCTLSRREDGAYEGQCRDESGGDAHMLMVPPKKSPGAG